MAPLVSGDEGRRTACWETSRPQSLLSTRWLCRHAMYLCLTALAWLVDEPAYRLMNSWYNGPTPIQGEVHQIVLSMAQYGQALGIVSTLALMLIFDVRHRGRVSALVTVLVVVGLIGGVAKTVVGRTRPIEAEGETIILGPHLGFAASRNQSFPSGHTATAFAMSYALAKFYPQTRPFVWPLAYAVGLNRVMTVRHFPSDVVAGAWLGYVLAAGMLGLVSVRRWSDRLSRWAAPCPLDWFDRLRWSSYHWRRLGRGILASPILLFAVSLAIHWTGNASTPLWDRDEPRFATATREMAARNDWIVPTFNAELRPDKPILVYWLMRFSYLALGDNPFGARFFSGLAGAVACLMTYFMGRAMFDRRVGLVAGWMLALSPMLIIESKLATADALLLACLTTCFFAFWRLKEAPESMRWPALFWIALGLGILAKGPVAPGAIAVALAGYAILSGDVQWLRALRCKWGVPLTIVIVAPWVIAVQWATKGDFVRVALGHHVLKRSLAPLENHAGFPGYYLATLAGAMAPWAWLLPWSLLQHRARVRRDSRIAFLVGWSLGLLAMFELVRTKLVHYYLPAYPALALFIASALVGRFASAPIGIRRFDARLPRILQAAGVGLVAIVIIVFAAITPTDVAIPASMTAVVMGAGLAVSGELFARRQFQRGFAILAGACATSFVFLAATVAPTIGQHRLVLQVAQRLEAFRERHAVALWLYRDPSIIYNVGESLPIVDGTRDDPIFNDSLDLAMDRGEFICPMTDKEFDAMAKDPTLTLDVVETVAGWDAGRFRHREIYLTRVRPSAMAAGYLQLRDELRRQMPQLAEISLRLSALTPTRLARLRSAYPLNPGFWSTAELERAPRR